MDKRRSLRSSPPTAPDWNSPAHSPGWSFPLTAVQPSTSCTLLGCCRETAALSICNVRAQVEIVAFGWLGMKTEKTVPEMLRPARLRTRSEPPCLCTMSCVTQRPRPVPVDSLVVKKGFEEAAKCGGRHTCAGIGDGEAD